MTPNFVVRLRELEDGPKELEGPLPREFLAHLLGDTDVQPEKDGTLRLILTKNGTDVLIQGRLDVEVLLPCARTLDPARYRLKPDVFLLLSPAPGETPRSNARPERERGKDRKSPANKKAGWEFDPELSASQAATDTYSGEQIVLDSFLREFILLEVPMVPLREDLRDVSQAANPPLPDAGGSLAKQQEKPLDPRLSPLRDLKARLEKKE